MKVSTTSALDRFQLIRRFALGCFVLLSFVGLDACGQQPSPDTLTPNPKTEESVSAERPNYDKKSYVAQELLAVEQLILMLSNRPNQEGAPQEALVFLGRSPQKGWQAIGLENMEELRSHWRTVAARVLAPYTQSTLETEKKEKIDLAIELSITQFVRLYSDLRTDFMEQTDQKARLALLTSDDRYENLRLLGREGLFKQNTLLGKAMHHILSAETAK